MSQRSNFPEADLCCTSCRGVITRVHPDVAIGVEKGDGNLSFYCTCCAPYLLRVSRNIERGRALREYVAAGMRVLKR
jgi:hypothetical protein